MVNAVVAAVRNDVAGAVNVAADGVVPLTRVAALLGKKLAPQVLPLTYIIAPSGVITRIRAFAPFSSENVPK